MTSLIRLIAMVAEWAAAALLAVFAVVRSLDPKAIQRPITRDLVQEIHDDQIAIVFLLASTIIASKAVQQSLENWTTNYKAIKAVLDTAHKTVFGEFPADQHYEHRVTLFRATRRFRDFPFNPLNWSDRQARRWPRTLRMYARSGTSYQRASTGLTIDDEDEKRNEGVAGQAWFNNAHSTVTGLPEWPQACIGSPHSQDCIDYAKKGFISSQIAHRMRVKSRSLSAHVVRKRTGVRWGVLVFDSRDDQGVADPAGKKMPIMELSAYLLSQLL